MNDVSTEESHLIRVINRFAQIENNYGGRVKLACEASTEIKGKRTAFIKTELRDDSCDVKVLDAVHVPDL